MGDGRAATRAQPDGAVPRGRVLRLVETRPARPRPTALVVPETVPPPAAVPVAAAPSPPVPRPDEPTTVLVSPRDDVARAGEAVRAVWARIGDREPELAHFFGALLFTLAPALRDRFPAQSGPAARRLLRAAVAAMSAVDRPGELAAGVAALAREHRSLGLDGSADEAVGVALVGAAREFAGELWAPGADAAWVRAYSLAAEPARRVAAALPAVVDATVVGHRRLSWDLAVITVAPDVPVDYRPGQSVTVEVPQRPRLWRHLTPAGAPRADGLLEFHVRAVEGGWVSRALVAHARCGERWRIGPAEGDLAVDAGAERELLLVGGGTGASVALAVCEGLAARAAAGVDVRPTTVLIGGRTPDDLHTLDRFVEIAESAPWLAVVGACESDPLDPDLAPGTVVDAVARSGPWHDHDVVVAGSPAMVRATTAALLADGTPPERIHHDPVPDDDV
ncbi:FAD-binding oxidoreductase [Actinomycetospora atypica]|uniref:FAD-binding oxidoreductase n=1 Tax=Actinomycetospora atypica TaxID=1290095 RepID=A0ABV9YFT0_9PSEU